MASYLSLKSIIIKFTYTPKNCRRARNLPKNHMTKLFRYYVAAALISLFLSIQVSGAQSRPSIGTGLWASSLGNIKVGSTNKKISLRYKSQHKGRLLGIRSYWQYSKRPGYHGGNGGNIKITLHPNDSLNTPDDQILSQTSFIPGLSFKDPENKDVRFDSIRFNEPALLRKGGLYHIVFENIDNNLKANWISLNALFSNHSSSELFAPKYNHRDWGYLAQPLGRSNWEDLTQFLPIFELEFDTDDDGVGDTYQGMGYMEVWRSRFSTVSGQAQVRQSFTIQADRKIRSLWIVATKLSGKGSLQATLKNSANEESFVKFPAKLFSSLSPTGVRKKISPKRTLLADNTYTLTLQTNPRTKYAVEIIRDGAASGYGFSSSSTLLGRVEKSINGGATWSGWEFWGRKDRGDGDLAFELY